jgi:hypothetical protein
MFISQLIGLQKTFQLSAVYQSSRQGVPEFFVPGKKYQRVINGVNETQFLDIGRQPGETIAIKFADHSASQKS